VAVYLTPGEVVSQVTDAGVADGAAIEGGDMRWLEGRVGKIGWPKLNVEGSEGG
jgi:hypothetical protein